jgi:hypothetical protein
MMFYFYERAISDLPMDILQGEFSSGYYKFMGQVEA